MMTFIRLVLFAALAGLAAYLAIPQGLAGADRVAARTAVDREGAGLVAGPLGNARADAPRQIWLILLAGQSMLMRALVLRPPGAGPFPLAVINHGSTQNSVRRKRFPMPAYDAASRWFLARGYVVVLPLRPGHGATAGPYLEDQGRCADADYRRAGLATATSIRSAVDYMTAQPFVRRSGAVVIGQSAGGWGALALASLNPRKVKAVINFSGGRGEHADDKPLHNCSPGRLVTAARSFGRTARIPTLWLNTENDTFFAPDLSQRMARAFHGAGGRVEYHLLKPGGGDGHAFIHSDRAVAKWGPLAEKFLGLRG